MGSKKKRVAKRRPTKRRTTKRRVSKKAKRRVSKKSKRKVSKKRKTSKKKRVSKKKKTVKRRKARKSIRGTRAQVFRGTRQKVKTTGQTKTDLMKSKSGKIVSKIAFKAGREAYKRNGLEKWTKAFMQARENLELEGFVVMKKGTPFYKEAMKIYKQ